MKPVSRSPSSWEGLMLKLKLQYSGHLMGKATSLEKALMLGKTEGGKRKGTRGPGKAGGGSQPLFLLLLSVSLEVTLALELIIRSWFPSAVFFLCTTRTSRCSCALSRDSCSH